MTSDPTTGTPTTDASTTDGPATGTAADVPGSAAEPTGERADLLETLRGHRHFLRFTVRGLTDEQARLRTTASELTLGGLIKHVTHTERNWVAFAQHGTHALAGTPESGSFQDGVEAYLEGFRLGEGETLQGVLDAYEQVAAATDELVATAPDLDVSHPLPQAPWFPPGARWSIRRVLLHIIAETSQHAGHADIIRESLDGQKTMG